MRFTICLPADQFEHVNLAISRGLIIYLGCHLDASELTSKFLVTGMVT